MLGDPPHEAEEALFLKRLDSDYAIAGTDVLVEAQNQGFSGR
jgi:hypothetical protein